MGFILSKGDTIEPQIAFDFVKAGEDSSAVGRELHLLRRTAARARSLSVSKAGAAGAAVMTPADSRRDVPRGV